MSTMQSPASAFSGSFVSSPKNAWLTLILLLIFISTIVLASSAWVVEDVNVTSPSVESDIQASITRVTPWPGSGWLKSIATDSSSYTWNDENGENITYTSAYEAMLNGNPADYPSKNFNCFVNSFFFSAKTASYFADKLGLHLGYYALSYLRNFISGVLLYYIPGLIFHYHCYIHPRSIEIFKDRIRPVRETIIDQIILAQSSLFIYVALPVFSDYIIEEGYTKCYYTLEEIGGFIPYLLWLLIYFALVEIGIYWMHRTLHENKFLYRYIHMRHHKYNKPDTLTPWASIAFHPVDGILQASPYVFWLLFVPCHYLTHLALVFFTALWAMYIHDSMDWNIDPIMGSKYHTVHHTHYIYNYGQIFTFCDAFWGTLRVPVGKTGVVKDRQKLQPSRGMGKKLQ